MTTLAKLTDKELTVLKAIDASEYGEFLIDDIWSFSIANNSNLELKSIPGICSSLAKKGYTRNGESDGEKTIGMTTAGGRAYLEIVGKNAKKFLDYIARKAAKEAETVDCSGDLDEHGNFQTIGDELDGTKPETKKEAKKARKAARAKLAEITQLLDAPTTKQTSDELVAAIRKLMAK